MTTRVLTEAIFLPLAGAAAILVIRSDRLARWLALLTTIATFAVSMPLYLGFDQTSDALQFVETAQSFHCGSASTASHAGLDELEERPGEGAETLVSARSLRGGSGVVVTAETVVQDRPRVGRDGGRPPFVVRRRILDRRGDQLQRPALLAPPGGEE